MHVENGLFFKNDTRSSCQVFNWGVASRGRSATVEPLVTLSVCDWRTDRRTESTQHCRSPHSCSSDKKRDKRLLHRWCETIDLWKHLFTIQSTLWSIAQRHCNGGIRHMLGVLMFDVRRLPGTRHAIATGGYLQGGPKKWGHNLMSIILSVSVCRCRFTIFFAGRFLGKFAVSWLLKILPLLAYVATLPCETLMSENKRLTINYKVV